MRLQFQKGDLLAIAAVLLLAAVVFSLFLPKEDAPGTRAEIYQNGELIRTVPLSYAQEFTVSGQYTNTVTVQNGRIAITSSTCPGGDCVRCGWLENTGRSLICLPNGLEIRLLITGDVDIAVG